jgi:iron complex transport system ATP-binding protein
MSARAASPPSSCLVARQLDVAIAGRTLLRRLDLAIAPGTVTAILGCNGAGKSMTLHTLAGLRAAAGGEVAIDGRPLDEWPARARSRKLGLLLQSAEDAFPSTVLETVLIGRHPHLGFWEWESAADRQIASAALAALALQGLEQRDVTTLSGGERRRVAIATMLAQNPDVLLLDEPINHLDPHHQVDVLKLLREKAGAGHAVLMSLHDAGLAARFADNALLLFGDGEWLSGPAGKVLTAATMTRLYSVPVREVSWAGGRTFVAE